MARRNKRFTAQQWAELVTEQEASGDPIDVFCVRKGVGISTFTKWRRRLLVDSAGPVLGKPVLLMREKTECPEAVESGIVRLVGTDSNTICATANRLLDEPGEYQKMSIATNPYGTGNACQLICEDLCGG